MALDESNEIKSPELNPDVGTDTNRRVLLSQWLGKTRLAKSTHYEVSKSLNQKEHYLSIPSIVISALVGTSIFVTLDQDPDILAKTIVGVLSISTAVLAALQSHLGLRSKSEEYRAYATLFGKVEKRIETVLADHYVHQKTLEAVRVEYDNVVVGAPTTKYKYYLAAKKKLEDGGLKNS